jgi:hypothetical protein
MSTELFRILREREQRHTFVLHLGDALLSTALKRTPTITVATSECDLRATMLFECGDTREWCFVSSDTWPDAFMFKTTRTIDSAAATQLLPIMCDWLAGELWTKLLAGEELETEDKDWLVFWTRFRMPVALRVNSRAAKKVLNSLYRLSSKPEPFEFETGIIAKPWGEAEQAAFQDKLNYAMRRIASVVVPPLHKMRSLSTH